MFNYFILSASYINIFKFTFEIPCFIFYMKRFFSYISASYLCQTGFDFLIISFSHCFLITMLTKFFNVWCIASQYFNINGIFNRLYCRGCSINVIWLPERTFTFEERTRNIMLNRSVSLKLLNFKRDLYILHTALKSYEFPVL